jgi:transposase InsO family protein
VKREQAQASEAQRVCTEVRKVRRYHPRMGTRKLQHVTEPQLKLAGIKVGRDRLFEILKENDLLVEPKRSYHRTTHPGTWRCENLLADAIINGPNRAWVGDITYLVTDEGFCYLVLLTDVYSRYIVGFDLSTSLCVEGAERALHQAIKAQKEVPEGLIHHSDRGVQYTCRSYRRKLEKHGMRSSMGQTGNCYDNALAERVNGILKQEYGLDGHFATVAQAREAVVQAIWLYNHERPHNSLDLQTPYDVHQHQLRKRLPQSKSSIFRAQGAKVLSVGLAA